MQPDDFIHIANGSLYVWGDNFYGELGVGNDLFVSQRTKIMDDIRMAYYHHGLLFVINMEDTLYAAGTWGGFDTIEIKQRIPELREKAKRVHASFRLTPLLENVHYVVDEYGTIICVKNDGTVWARGQEKSYLLGTGRLSKSSLSEFLQVHFRK